MHPFKAVIWNDLHCFLLPGSCSLCNRLSSLFHSTLSHVTDPRCSFYKPCALRVQGTAETVRLQLFKVYYQACDYRRTIIFFERGGVGNFLGHELFSHLWVVHEFFLVGNSLSKYFLRSQTQDLDSTKRLLVCFLFSRFCGNIYIFGNYPPHPPSRNNQVRPLYPKWMELVKYYHSLHALRRAMASWLVRLSPERAAWVRSLAGDIVLCSWARHFTLTVPLSTQVYKCVPVNCWGNLTNCGGSDL